MTEGYGTQEVGMPKKEHVFPLSSIPPEGGLRLEIEGMEEGIAVFRRGDRIFAVGDSCTHMGASLSEGYLDDDCVVCPWHGWVFRLEDGASVFELGEALPVYPVRLEGDQVIVEIELDESAGTSESTARGA
jgi:nitrite reductase/ring-hydroxylating ferredoxin subunit